LKKVIKPDLLLVIGVVLNRKEVGVFQYVKETNHLMTNGGLFLVAKGKSGKANAMTIGWGFIGTMWRKPVFIVAVRHSRYTFKLLEESDSFTVCLPAKGQEEWLDVCGNKSGRDMDKFKKLGMTEKKGLKVNAPYIEECPVHFECEIIYKDDLDPEKIKREIKNDVYPAEDMHVLYYGEVKATYAADKAEKKLA
jgi:flavin reductase (DIM6/NTAB) family NADH-FMN oxidoreductase RutF